MQPIHRTECDEDDPTVQMSDDQRRLLIATFTPPTMGRRSLPDPDASIEAQAVPVSPLRVSQPSPPSLRWWGVVLASAAIVALSLLGGAAVLQIW
ncbi:MAG: hypothetical protein H6735_08030 [Alphaproteobacteria bacterium]|nr:hypothetical protein [Alphaproteobacteria bacterium]